MRVAVRTPKRRKRLLAHVINRTTSKYKPQYINQAYVACAEMGADLEQLGKLFLASSASVKRWMKEFPEFKKAILEGREIFDTAKVERALVQRAVGFEYDEVTTERVLLANKADKGKANLPAIKKKVTTKLYPAEASCIYFWLINRQPERWKNTKYVQFRGTVDDKRKQRVNIDRLKQMPLQDVETMAEFLTQISGEDGETSVSAAEQRTPRPATAALH